MSRSRSFLRQQSAASPVSGAWPVLLMGNERLRADRCICFWLNEPQKRSKFEGHEIPLCAVCTRTQCYESRSKNRTANGSFSLMHSQRMPCSFRVCGPFCEQVLEPAPNPARLAGFGASRPRVRASLGPLAAVYACKASEKAARQRLRKERPYGKELISISRARMSTVRNIFDKEHF